MRELMRIVESKALDALMKAFGPDRDDDDRIPLEDFPKRTLPKGTVLYHGTDSQEDFSLPTGDCVWFTLDPQKAKTWAGWASHPSRGPARVIECRTTQDLVLYDTTDETTYFELCFTLTGDPEHPHMAVARELEETGAQGWISDGRDGEIMLCNPADKIT